MTTSTYQDTGTKNKLTDTLEKTAREGIEQTQKAAAELGEAAEGLGKSAKALWVEGKNAARDQYDQATEAISTKGRRVYEGGEQAVIRTKHYVQENPLRAVGIAAVVAFLAGRLIAGRSR